MRNLSFQLIIFLVFSLFQLGVNAQWKVGDKVMVQDMYANYEWEAATITLVHNDWNPVKYKASLDNPAGHRVTELLLDANQVRSLNKQPGVNFTLDSRVDVYYPGGDPRGRATVIEVKGNGRYKVHYDGCSEGAWDEDVDWSQLKFARYLASNHPDITGLLGKWAMFVYSYPNTVTNGNNIYRQYGTGNKAPPLQINANGTYVWYDVFNKPPVKGTWSTHSKIEGLTVGTESVNGIVLEDSYGIYWKVYEDMDNHIIARKFCSGQTVGGSRIN